MSPAPSTSGFTGAIATRVVAGEGCVAELGRLAAEIGGKHALLVTDAGVRKAGHAARAQQALEAAGLRVTPYDRVAENPTSDVVADCVGVARAAGIDLIVGLGGGSSMDVAKGCNFVLTNGGRMEDYWGYGKATQPMLPLIAVPTTAGTGSECQCYALICHAESHRKMACGDPKAAARIALLDPLLTLTQPRAVAAATGIDALAHALESAVATKRTAISSRLSQEAFRLGSASLATVLTQPDDLAARGAMQLGAAYAGAAIENSMLGAAHSAANSLTARYGLVHGRAIGVMLPHVLRFNAEDPAIATIYTGLAGRPAADIAAQIDELLRLAASAKSAYPLTTCLPSPRPPPSSGPPGSIPALSPPTTSSASTARRGKVTAACHHVRVGAQRTRGPHVSRPAPLPPLPLPHSLPWYA
jgi:alcohol dehydrogenase